MMNAPARLTIFERMSSLADHLRSRLLLVLERRELTVTELCSVLKLPQSTVSRHLKTLADTGWIGSRPDGTKRLYRFDPAGLDEDTRRLWEVARPPIEESPPARQDARRLERVLARRRARSRAFFDSAAEGWDHTREATFGDRLPLQGLLGLLPAGLRIADLGCGTGPTSEALAPLVERVLAVDASESMLRAARRRLEPFDNVELRTGELEALPIADRSVDAATLVLVLHHVAEPPRVLSEAARILRPGGQLLIVDMLPHDRQDYERAMGHVWMGFDRERIVGFLEEAGLAARRFAALPVDPEAEGPGLFVCTAVPAPSDHAHAEADAASKE
jgi:ArsR family transcriptional regulator